MASVPLMTTGKDNELQEWVVELEKELQEFSRKEDTIYEYPVIFFRVPKVLRDAHPRSYSPSLVSMGPYHFGKDDLSRMERHKSEALFRMQKRMQWGFPEIKSLIERDIAGMDNRVRQCYTEEIPYNSNVLAWILTRDACFAFEIIFNVMRINQMLESQQVGESHPVYQKYHPVFNASSFDPIWDNILSDLILFENQIPLFILERLIEIMTGSETAAERELQHMLSYSSSYNTNSIFDWGGEVPCYEKGKCYHLLDVVYYRTVGSNLESYHLQPFVLAEKFIRFFSAVRAVELVKAGVKFRAVTSKDGMPGAPIEWVKFDEKTSTLYLPEVRLDEHRHKLMRNLIALELTSNNYRPRPFTFFAMFMDELIDSKEDVDVLTKAGIIKNSLGSNEQVAECFNTLTQGVTPASGRCRCIEDARQGLEKYMKRRFKILWNQFLSAYFSKPWFVAGSMGATLLLLMTVLQVFCLFYTCSH